MLVPTGDCDAHTTTADSVRCGDLFVGYTRFLAGVIRTAPPADYAVGGGDCYGNDTCDGLLAEIHVHLLHQAVCTSIGTERCRPCNSEAPVAAAGERGFLVP
jgi:hypothetical protein